ncbi:hypothetical protein [Kribbella pittospori]|nr:hypothetical protein [Kribbella pittospori]
MTHSNATAATNSVDVRKPDIGDRGSRYAPLPSVYWENLTGLD